MFYGWQFKVNEGYKLLVKFNQRICVKIRFEDVCCVGKKLDMKFVGLEWNEKKCVVVCMERRCLFKQWRVLGMIVKQLLVVWKKVGFINFYWVLENVKYEDRIVF